MNLSLDLLQYQDELKRTDKQGKQQIFDPIRKKYLIQTPEELVRQLLIIYLQKELKISKTYIAVEKSFKINQRIKRFDLLVFDKQHKPYLLVECKSPQIKIDQSTFEQVAWYNYHFKVPYLLVTNGIMTYCCSIDFEKESFSFLDYIPAQ